MDIESVDLDRLRRWTDAGGTWELLGGRPDEVTVVLCRCDAGEEVDRFTSADPALLAYLKNHEG